MKYHENLLGTRANMWLWMARVSRLATSANDDE